MSDTFYVSIFTDYGVEVDAAVTRGSNSGCRPSFCDVIWQFSEQKKKLCYTCNPYILVEID